MPRFKYAYSVAWNIMLILAGSLLMALGLKAIAFQFSFLQGGMFGVSLLLYYMTGILSPGIMYGGCG